MSNGWWHKLFPVYDTQSKKRNKVYYWVTFHLRNILVNHFDTFAFIYKFPFSHNWVICAHLQKHHLRPFYQKKVTILICYYCVSSWAGNGWKSGWFHGLHVWEAKIWSKKAIKLIFFSSENWDYVIFRYNKKRGKRGDPEEIFRFEIRNSKRYFKKWIINSNLNIPSLSPLFVIFVKSNISAFTGKKIKFVALLDHLIAKFECKTWLGGDVQLFTDSNFIGFTWSIFLWL